MSNDDINNPTHYTGDIECVDAMKQQATPEEFRGYLRLTAFKYLWRMGRKEGNPPDKDAGKAKWFITKLQEELHLAALRGGRTEKSHLDVIAEEMGRTTDSTGLVTYGPAYAPISQKDCK